MNVKARRRMSEGAMRVMRSSPFYSTIIIKHQMVEDENINGMAINGTEIHYNPDAVLTQTPAEIAEYLKAMAMKVAFKHHIRMGAMRPIHERKLKEENKPFDQVFNESSDLAVNSILRKENSQVWQSDNFKEAPLPGNGKWKELEDGWSVEQYFPKVASIFEPPMQTPNGAGGSGEGDGQGQGQSPSGCSGNQESDDGQGQGQNQSQEGGKQDMHFSQVQEPQQKNLNTAEDEADQMIAEAVLNAKGAGEQTGSVKEFIAENEKPVKVNWRAECEQFFETACRGRKNYRHINRRLWSKSIVFPTNKDKAPKKVLFYVDVSGSMDNESVGAVYNHIEEVIKAKQSLVIELIPFDGGVFDDHIKEFNRDNIPIGTEARGRCGFGGTKFMPVAHHATKKAVDEDISGVVMLTDRLPCDSKAFEGYKPDLPWLILSVLEHQFGLNSYDACTPQWCRILEIEP